MSAQSTECEECTVDDPLDVDTDPFTDTAEEDAVDTCDEDTCDEDEDQSDTDSEYSFDAPPFSPINETCEEGDIANVESLEISEDVLCEQTEQLHHDEQVEQLFQQSQSTWTGFKLAGDNLDKISTLHLVDWTERQNRYIISCVG